MAARALTGAYQRDRHRLVERLQASGIEDLAILHAFASVPRHRFLPEAVRHRAYTNAALPIGHGQTISRPGVHALHLALCELGGDERVLEIGTGSGFQTALLSLLAGEVYSIERIPELAEAARQALQETDAEGVHLLIGDGSGGWPEAAPFDVILIGAAAPEPPAHLYPQLAPGGRLIVPVGDAEHQALVRVRARQGTFDVETIDRARFVPLIGARGW
ncbi:MAG: protein-L-isoaspartate(D-aspartate) O-methyltransferase [Gemmatimonadales bacterium]